jgi:hypothetical protein
MMSKRAFAGATTTVASYPAALAVQSLLGSGGVTVIHFMMGIGFIVFATSVFDFSMPRWVNAIGAATAGAFGGIFLLQGLADLTDLAGLRYVAFNVLGHLLERLLPDVVYLWFVALLLLFSKGRSRVLGGVVMVIVIGLEIAALVSILIGVPIPSVKLIILLPFLWLLFESAESKPRERSRRQMTKAGTG